ncbi:hypothetical protein [Mycolicibacterium litorale]|uniref:Lipoprotein n=1 Tax=Mycolicibacterium litorale TaxID=758802 RepID=A0AAD1IP23_9MYCO|nr:hypothetical protein [Mycolicibacterium litorale]MCV7416857.1 hypothetical protein [Mycolicibacterium litorale]TDY04642.1 hypothetical protein BCL50_3417 [Mycolicibacterium litorale]BBY18068.1 hypothetical protein MLIT_36600 [Mycolicibacterium litorale]
MRALFAVVVTVLLVAVSGCSEEAAPSDTYAAPTAKVGESLQVSGWNISVSNVRFEAEHVLVDVDAAHSGDGEPVAPESLRFGLYGALVHPIETNGLGGCQNIDALTVTPLAAPSPDRLSGTVCLGPQRDQSQVRGVYVYSPQDRMPGTTVAYAAAFPVGLLPTTDTETGLTLKSTSLEAFRADGAQLNQSALGDPEAFTGNGYMLLGLDIDGLASRYREDSTRRGGPLMVVAAPSLPGKGLSYACSAYGASVLVLPDASREAVAMRASLCTQGEINSALLYASVSVIGTHAALWTLE